MQLRTGAGFLQLEEPRRLAEIHQTTAVTFR